MLHLHLEVVPQLVELEVAVLPPRPLALRASGVSEVHERKGGTAITTVSPGQVAAGEDRVEEVLPEHVQEALGELVGAAKCTTVPA